MTEAIAQRDLLGHALRGAFDERDVEGERLAEAQAPAKGGAGGAVARAQGDRRPGPLDAGADLLGAGELGGQRHRLDGVPGRAETDAGRQLVGGVAGRQRHEVAQDRAELQGVEEGPVLDARVGGHEAVGRAGEAAREHLRRAAEGEVGQQHAVHAHARAGRQLRVAERGGGAVQSVASGSSGDPELHDLEAVADGMSLRRAAVFERAQRRAAVQALAHQLQLAARHQGEAGGVVVDGAGVVRRGDSGPAHGGQAAADAVLEDLTRGRRLGRRREREGEQDGGQGEAHQWITPIFQDALPPPAVTSRR